MGTMKTVSFQPSAGTKRTGPQHWEKKRDSNLLRTFSENPGKQISGKELFQTTETNLFQWCCFTVTVNDLFIRTFYISNREEVGGFHTEIFLWFFPIFVPPFSLRAPTPKNWEGGQTQRSTNWSRSSTDNPVIGAWHLVWKTNPDKSPTNLVNAPPTRAKRVRSCECLHLSIHHSFMAVSACAFYLFYIEFASRYISGTRKFPPYRWPWGLWRRYLSF